MGLNFTVADVSDLKKEREQSKVSFSASLLKEGRRNIGPTTVDAPLVFRNDFTNIGNAYSANTGVFTAPTRGVYFFVVFVLGQGHGSTATGVWLFKNDKRLAFAWSHQQDGFTKPSNGASVVMEKGDEVYVKLNSGAWVHDNENNNCVFSGHLLFPM
ncbi:complement C1q-like protein 4 [Engraulis encrasicolus]|uniref:complement C1q-like protein 4 n=1 Tax=Engraulis encrasicolus TaxID=184585 RepID=UPI002FD50ADC